MTLEDRLLYVQTRREQIQAEMIRLDRLIAECEGQIALLQQLIHEQQPATDPPEE